MRHQPLAIQRFMQAFINMPGFKRKAAVFNLGSPLSPDEVIDCFGLQYTPPGTGTGTGTGTSTPVYRFAKISNGHYFFTANQTEKQYIESSLHDFPL